MKSLIPVFTSEILKNLAAVGSSDSESDAVEGWWTKSTKTPLNLKLRHVGLTDKAKAWISLFYGYVYVWY